MRVESPGPAAASDADDGVRGPTTPRVVARLAVLGVTTTIGSALLYWLTVGTRTGQLVGEITRGGVSDIPGLAVAADRLLRTVSPVMLLVAVILVASIAVLRRRPWLAAAAVVTILGANLTTQVLKRLILGRVDLLDGLFYPLPNSFPSGHVTIVASVVVAGLIVVPPLVRGALVPGAGLATGIVGVATLAAGWHHMADAVGGVLVATTWAAGAGVIVAWERGVHPAGRWATRVSRTTTRATVLAGGVIALVALAAYGLVAADPLEVLDELAGRGGSLAVFWVGAALTLGLTMLAIGLLGHVLRDVDLDDAVQDPFGASRATDPEVPRHEQGPTASDAPPDS